MKSRFNCADPRTDLIHTLQYIYIYIYIDIDMYMYMHMHISGIPRDPESQRPMATIKS